MSKMGELHYDLEMLATSKEHGTAMAVRAMMSAITDLCEMASTGIGADLIRSDMDDIELSYARLAQLVHALRVPVREAAE